jgi:hypothetical protein
VPVQPGSERAVPPLTAFNHLGSALDVLRTFLDGALEARATGVNVLVVGPTAASGLEVIQALAGRLSAAWRDLAADAPQIQPGGTGHIGNPIRAAGRPLDGGLGRELWIVDVRSEDSMSSYYLRDKFAPPEDNPSPVVWLVSSMGAVPPQVRPRFQYVLEVHAPGPLQRRGYWDALAGPEVPPEAKARLASAYPMSIGDVQASIQAARRCARDGWVHVPILEQFAATRSYLRTGERPAMARRASGDAYRLGALTASMDLELLASKLAGRKPGQGAAVSLCLYGPPGTGKSEFVHHLAARLDLKVLQQRVSDIVTPWVGDSERRLAEAFRQAEAEGAILLLDEADTFLMSRAGGASRFDVSLTNEFLQRLESCGCFVACTTNLFRSLDEAVLRRFTFKVEFGYLKPEQAVSMFEVYLGPLLDTPFDEPCRQEVATVLPALGDLTPGDFANVARRAAVLSSEWPVEQLVAELRAELEARRKVRPAA